MIESKIKSYNVKVLLQGKHVKRINRFANKEEILPRIKTVCFCLFLMLYSSTVQATKFMRVDHAHQANYEVFIVDHAHQADCKIFLVDYAHQARRGSGNWFQVNYCHEADIKVKIVEHRHQADFTIYLVKHRHEAKPCLV